MISLAFLCPPCWRFSRPRQALRRTVSATLAGACAAWLLAAAGASAQTYPDRPITLQVGYAPGGTTDKVARLLAIALKDSLGQSVVVENRPGAGGTVAAASVAKAAPDGYTLYFTTISSHAIGPALYTSLGFDPVKSFEPVALVARYPLLMLANPAFGSGGSAATLDLLRSSSNKYFFGSAGVGSAGHLTGELAKSMAGISMTHVAYKGGSAAAMAAMSGEIEVMIDPLPGLMGYARSGQLKPIAVSSPARSPVLPDVPTFAELGLKGFDTSSWAGVVAPAGTPGPVLARLQEAIAAALRSKVMVSGMANDGVEASFMPADQFQAFIGSEMKRWGEVVRANGIRTE